ncbi:MAG: glucose-6-phosphate isomerase [Bryobacter sp.]|nr:glucose-6-phosphate isomerase [Bryobacter sp.]
MGITFDPRNLMDRMVGKENGLSEADVEGAQATALAAVRGFRKLYEEGHYGFPDLPANKALVKEIEALAKKLAGTFDTVCVVGIGGSALGCWALDCGLRGPHPVQAEFSVKNPRLVILDNVDPDFVEQALASMRPKKTVVVVIAKSGSTAETMSTFLIVREWLMAAMGKKASDRIIAVTSEGRGDLKVLATQENYATFHIPENVGGRFSVFSAVGLVPAALTGVNLKKLLRGAAEMTEACWREDLEENIALNAALHHWLVWTKKGKSIQVAFPYSNYLWGTAFWFRQLWAESLGKKKNRQGQVVHVGQTPVAALGTTDQHSQVQLYMEGPNDKVFSFWTVNKTKGQGKIPKTKLGLDGFDYLGGKTLGKLIDAERRATEAALATEGRPNCTFTLDKVDEEHLGAFLQMMEFETAFLGEMLDINAFDQEGVELGKKFTYALMGRSGWDEFKERFAAYEAKRS